MSRKKRNPKDWKRGHDPDSDELEAGQGHTTPRDTTKNVQAPAEEWVDVPKGMMAAPDTYVDNSGYIRSSVDNSYVAWHFKGCNERGLTPETIFVDPATGAPWCKACWETNKKKAIAAKAALAVKNQDHMKQIKEIRNNASAN